MNGMKIMSLQNWVLLFALLATTSFCNQVCCGDVLISQYYENSDDDRVLEFVNVGPSTVNFSTAGLFLGSWNDANTESYKSATMPDGFASFDTFFSGLTMESGEVLVVNISSGTISPVFPFDFQGSIGTLNADGNDSLAIYEFESGSYNVKDVVGFTTAGFEGMDVSWERISRDPGFDLNAGSSVTDFDPIVWIEHSTDAVDAATSGGMAIGYSSLVAAVPEPSGLALLTGICATVIMRRRRN